MGDRLFGTQTGLALLANALATGAGLLVLISVFGPVSGAHFNPVVTWMALRKNELLKKEAWWFIGGQIAGGLLGVVAVHAMFAEPLAFSEHSRTGWPQWWSELIATFGLLMVILGSARVRPDSTPWLVAAYITSAYWFTSSTSFANPAVTIARTITHTFSGIAPIDAIGFILAQCTGAWIAFIVCDWLFDHHL